MFRRVKQSENVSQSENVLRETLLRSVCLLLQVACKFRFGAFSLVCKSEKLPDISVAL